MDEIPISLNKTMHAPTKKRTRNYLSNQIEVCNFCGNNIWIPFNETECCQQCGAIKFDKYVTIIRD